MKLEQGRTDWPLADVQLRLGKEFKDVLFFFSVQMLTLPFFAKAFSKHSKEGVKRMLESTANVISMWFNPKKHSEMEEVLLHANRVHASLGIPHDQILAALATFAVTFDDWIKSNTPIEFGDREEQDLLDGLSEVGRIMKIGTTPDTIAEYRGVFNSYCSTDFSPVARRLLIKGFWGYWKIQGVSRLPFAFVILTTSVPSRLHGVFGFPQFPVPFYKVIQKVLRVRWIIHDLFAFNGLRK